MEYLADCDVGKAPRLDGLSYEKYIPHLFRHLLASIYTKLQQNRSIPRSVRRATGTLVRKNLDKGDSVDNFKLTTLLNTQLKILVKLLVKRFARVIDELIGKAQTRAIPGRTIKDNLHLLCNTLDGFDSKFGKSEALIYLEQAKIFDGVEHRYLVSVLEQFDLDLAFFRLVITIYDTIFQSCSVSNASFAKNVHSPRFSMC